MPSDEYEEFILKKTEEELKVSDPEGKKEEQSKFVNKPMLLRDISPDEVKKVWIWETLIAKGHVTLISASPKDGKSTLIRCFLKALLNNEEFAGEPVTKCNILVISEESKSEWHEEGDNFGLLDESLNLWVWSRPFFGNLSKKEWVDFIAGAVDFCKEQSIDLMIMDSITAFWPVLNENDNSEATQALKAFYAFTENNIAVFLVHHDNKAGGSNGKSIRGASSILQFVDQAIMFGRLEGTNENSVQRVLKFRGRLREDDMPIIINYDLNEFQYNLNPGSLYEVSKKYKTDVILKILEQSEKPLSVNDLHNLWDETYQGKKPNVRSFRRYIDSLKYQEFVRIVEHQVIIKKKTPFYGLKNREYVTQDNFPYIDPPTARSNNKSNDSENGVVRNSANQAQKESTDGVQDGLEEMPSLDPRI